ncbi:MAG TPA: hypothetical protein VFS88_08960 [Micavibrio sp.]|nr:hypothetical protein [Micavibrio sp.]
MFKDAFIKLDPVQAARMVGLINPALDIKFDPDKSNVMIHNLPFYENYFIAEISRHDQQPPIVRAAVCNDKGEINVLNWSNEPIMALNKKAPIALNEENTPDYIRFFFTYVRGSHGRFLIIDTVDDIDWREEPAPAGRKALAKMIEPLHVKKRMDDGTVIYAVSVIFKDSLFAAEAHVRLDGTISLHNEELLVEDIPVADDLFGQ